MKALETVVRIGVSSAFVGLVVYAAASAFGAAAPARWARVGAGLYSGASAVRLLVEGGRP